MVGGAVAAGHKIEIANLTASYGGKAALRDITLAIPRNEIFGIIGPANSGKTTLLKCINRTIEMTPGARVRGGIAIDGEDIFRRRNVHDLRRRIGMVFPLPVGLPITVFDNVAYAPRLAGIRVKAELAEIVERCLRQAALWDEVKDDLKKSGLALSGGQQQRLCIARTLAVEPDVILMDEPCSALDPIATQRIEDLMRELVVDYSIVIVTHNMQQARRVSDYTAFFTTDESRTGELVEFNRTEKLFSMPADPRTADYIAGRFG